MWTQGLSEEGGARMKTFHYGSKIIGTLYNLVTIASGLKGVSLAAGLKAIVSQRLVRATAGGRVPVVEILLNTKLIAELIEQGDFTGVKEAMAKQGNVINISSPEFAQKFFKDELVKYAKLVKRAGLEPQ